MEKSSIVKVVPADIGWSDLGSFDSVYTEMYNPAKENAILGSVEPILVDSTENLIMSDRKVALVDVSDLLVIDTEDALLISKRGSSQKVKEVVSTLQKENSVLLDSHITVKRPWWQDAWPSSKLRLRPGSYTVLQDEVNFKVKKLMVTPGKKLSLQLHHKRQEHWTVVEGLARVTVDDKIMNLSRNETTYIPAGAKHRLENLGQVPLCIIETQIGSYFGEDDIVRFDDDWGRE
ncbi:cupin domain-containing protein [Thiospirochaeta perfilievii]|nr:cupin domain-containing protein [Thiospirochaeta perfilievii]